MVITKSTKIMLLILAASFAITLGMLFRGEPDHRIVSGNPDTNVFPPDGNVGIGTINPSSTLHMDVGASQYSEASPRISGRFPSLSFYDNSGAAADRNWAIAAPWHYDGDFAIFQSNAPNGDPRNEGRARFYIDSSGNIGVGTTSPSTRLHVVGAIRASSYQSASDARLKTNITPLTDVLEKLEEVRGVSFNWNQQAIELGYTPGKSEIGIVAQELEAAFPDLVSSSGNDEYKTIDYGKLSSVLLQAVKELRAENDNLGKRIEVLEDTMPSN